METAPIFYFGMWSIMSGSMIYHLLMYSAYNPVFTALPIIWYSTMDTEYPKSKLLSEPEEYKYGIRNLHFNSKIFSRWVFDAFW